MKNSFKELRHDELQAKLTELRKKYFDLRFQVVVGHVENPLLNRIYRRQIARLSTRIRLHEIEAQDKAMLQVMSQTTGEK